MKDEHDTEGSWVVTAAIVALGIAAIVLAVVEADHEAMASIFAFTGVATALFGLLLSRLEGDFELSATGFKGKLLREGRAVAVDEELTVEERGEALVALFAESLKRHAAPPRAGSRAGDLPQAIAPFVWPAPSKPGALSLRHAPREFASHVARAFEVAGWQVTRVHPKRAMDLEARRGDERLLIEVKAARHLSTADIGQMRDRHRETAGPGERWVLAVPAEALSAAAARLAEETENLDVLYVPVAEER